MARLIELSEEQHDDFVRLAKALAAIEKNNKIVKAIGAKYLDFVDEFEDQLRRGLVIDDLELGLKVTRKLLATEA